LDTHWQENKVREKKTKIKHNPIDVIKLKKIKLKKITLLGYSKKRVVAGKLFTLFFYVCALRGRV